MESFEVNIKSVRFSVQDCFEVTLSQCHCIIQHNIVILSIVFVIALLSFSDRYKLAYTQLLYLLHSFIIKNLT
jgi:hypothetical protein